MSCRTIRFSCPIGANTCKWTVECCKGNKYSYELGENRTEDLCLSKGSTILLNSQYGSWNDAESNCSTNCGAVDPTPIVGYEYKEYQNCSNASEKQVFRAVTGYTSWPTVLRYNSICWENGTVVTTVTNIDVSSLPSFAEEKTIDSGCVFYH